MNDWINQLATEAHDRHTYSDGTFRPRDVAMHFVSSVEKELATGSAEVAAFLDRFTVSGASKWLTDWRRRARYSVKTAKGTGTNVSQWAGIVNAEGEHQQMPLFAMTAEQLRDHRDKLKATRDTLSVEVRFLSDILDALEADPTLRTAADAVAKLGLAA